jgi:hypothetical protein
MMATLACAPPCRERLKNIIILHDQEVLGGVSKLHPVLRFLKTDPNPVAVEVPKNGNQRLA